MIHCIENGRLKTIFGDVLVLLINLDYAVGKRLVDRRHLTE